MGTQKHDDAPEPQSPERRSPPTVNEIVEELKSLPLNVGYNRLANELFKTGPLPWDADSQERRWRDSDDARLFALLQQIISLQKEKFMLLALTIVGEDNAYDPLVAMLDALTWDGIPRVGTLLNVYLGAERNAYVSEVERILFCEGIARAYSPGLQGRLHAHPVWCRRHRQVLLREGPRHARRVFQRLRDQPRRRQAHGRAEPGQVDH